jgi:hypothetical protein
MLLLLWVLQVPSQDTLKIGSIDHPPSLRESIDSAHLGPPQIRLRIGHRTALIWLLRAADTVFIAASIPDSTPYWGDDLVLGLDIRGDGSPSPQHDDLLWDFRRVLDSSVVFRGRNGRWQPPRNDPDWRLGGERGGVWVGGNLPKRPGWVESAPETRSSVVCGRGRSAPPHGVPNLR